MKTEVESEPTIPHSALRELLEDDELPSHESKEEGVNLLHTAVAYCHFCQSSPSSSRKRSFIAETVSQESNPDKNKKRKTSHTHEGAQLRESQQNSSLQNGMLYRSGMTTYLGEGRQAPKFARISAVKGAQTEEFQRARKRQKFSHMTHSWSSPRLHIAKALVNCMDMRNYIHETNIYPKNLPKTLFDLSGNCPCGPRPPGRSRSSGWRGYPRGQQATAETSAGLTTMA